MKKLFLTLAIIAGSYGLSNAQTTNKLVVKVTNIQSNKGNIAVAVCNSKETFLGKAIANKSKKAKTGEMTFEFEVSNGDYTVRVMHDEDKDGKLNTNFMGIPTEPYGISMDGKSRFGPPSYEDALFTIADKGVKLTIKIE
ncbi:MAG: DUF2141 domain-containing protein [Cyclobacteriaceae bacterium]|nr:DUF2141 domain-containing protein [Cyclobacteriaceae bacterium]